MKTKIYGASDDLIEIEGEICEEYDCIDFESAKVKASDGTSAKLTFNGEWKFTEVDAGSKLSKHIKAVGEDLKHGEEDAIGCTSYSDVLVFDDGLEWIKIGRKTFKK